MIQRWGCVSYDEADEAPRLEGFAED